MQKHFCITGTCIPKKHYMVDMNTRIEFWPIYHGPYPGHHLVQPEAFLNLMRKSMRKNIFIKCFFWII